MSEFRRKPDAGWQDFGERQSFGAAKVPGFAGTEADSLGSSSSRSSADQQKPGTEQEGTRFFLRFREEDRTPAACTVVDADEHPAAPTPHGRCLRCDPDAGNQYLGAVAKTQEFI